MEESLNKCKFHCIIGWAELEDFLGRVIERVSYKDHGWHNADAQNWKNRFVVFIDTSEMWVSDFISERANNKAHNGAEIVWRLVCKSVGIREA